MEKNRPSLNKVLSFIFFCVVFWGFHAQTSFAEEDVLEIAVGQWPPYISETQKHNGVIAHVITEVFSKMDVDAKVVFLPWGRAYKLTTLGKYTATGVWMEKDERKEDFIYSDAILNEQFVFFHKKSFKFEWTDMNSLRGLSVGGGIKYSYGEVFDSAVDDGTINIERVNSPEQNFAKLLSGRIDVFPEEVNVGYSFLQKHFPVEDRLQITFHPTPLIENQSFVLFPKILPNSVSLVERFNTQLRIFKEEGTYDQFMEDYKSGKYALDFAAPGS